MNTPLIIDTIAESIVSIHKPGNKPLMEAVQAGLERAYKQGRLDMAAQATVKIEEIVGNE